MDDTLTAYFMVDRISPVLALAIVAGIFAAVRRSERVKPVKAPRNG